MTGRSGRPLRGKAAAVLGQHLPGTVGGGHYTWNGIDEPVPSGFEDVADVDLAHVYHATDSSVLVAALG